MSISLTKTSRIYVLKFLRCFWKFTSVNTLTFFLMKLHLTYLINTCKTTSFSLLSVCQIYHCLSNLSWCDIAEKIQLAFCDHSLFLLAWIITFTFMLHLFVTSSLLAHIYSSNDQELDCSSHFVIFQHVLGHSLLHSEHFQQSQSNNAPTLHAREKASEYCTNRGASTQLWVGNPTYQELFATAVIRRTSKWGGNYQNLIHNFAFICMLISWQDMPWKDVSLQWNSVTLEI